MVSSFFFHRLSLDDDWLFAKKSSLRISISLGWVFIREESDNNGKWSKRFIVCVEATKWQSGSMKRLLFRFWMLIKNYSALSKLCSSQITAVESNELKRHKLFRMLNHEIANFIIEAPWQFNFNLIVSDMNDHSNCWINYHLNKQQFCI